MIEPQPIETITADSLLAQVEALQKQGYRLAQIGATRLQDSLELNYGFDLAGNYRTLRLQLPLQGGGIASISGIYWCAFIYENEIHDLFGLKVAGMKLDFQGKFYRTATPFPFNPATVGAPLPEVVKITPKPNP